MVFCSGRFGMWRLSPPRAQFCNLWRCPRPGCGSLCRPIACRNQLSTDLRHLIAGLNAQAEGAKTFYMSEESDRMLALLQELALLKNAMTDDLSAHRKRRKEIRNEIKQLAAQKEQANEA